MDTNDEAFRKRLLATFRVEAQEHIHALSSGLMALEKTENDSERQSLVETVFRETHSLKGAARTVGKTMVGRVCQPLESVFSLLKGGGLTSSSALFDLLHETVELLSRLLAENDDAALAPYEGMVEDIQHRLTMTAEGNTAPADNRMDEIPAQEAHTPSSSVSEPPLPEPVPMQAPETVRVAVTCLDAILFQSESMLSTKLTAYQRVEEIRLAQAGFVAAQRARMRITPEMRMLQRRIEHANRQGDAPLRQLLEYLVEQDEFLKTHGSRLEALAKSAEHDWRTLSGMVDGLLHDLKMALMLPATSAVEMLPRFVREAARGQGKEVDLHIDGSDIEIDRRILEDVRDPLIHLIRNSLDHGIETPETRLAAGKPRRGRIGLRISQLEGGRVEIAVEDDGAGILIGKVRDAAQKLGIVHGDEGMLDDEKALTELIFHSGLSTNDIITDFSGRGLGLAIVREKVERLGGSVSVHSDPGQGTCFRLVLPLTLATFRGVHVRCGTQEFIFPTLHLSLVTRITTQHISTVEGRETISLGNQVVALCRLAPLLGVSGAPASSGPLPVIVAGSGESRIAFLIDEVLGEQEVLVKKLGRQLRKVRNIFGATVLGNGRVLPILHVPDLLLSARSTATDQGQALPIVEERTKSLLVAEDSITSRMLLKGILESAGYRVRTAVDGLDAFTQLRTEPFDLLISDVDMPRMNGFNLTEKVRADQALADLPVVLVTSLDTREHKERGANVGANAYIVKSSFDQSNLLAVVRRLL